MLVEELGGLVDVIIRTGIRAADDHDRQAGCFGRRGVIDAVVVDRRLQQVLVLLKPGFVSRRPAEYRP